MKGNLEEVRCNFCDSDNYKIRYVKDGFNIVQCNVCGLVYVNPRLTSQGIMEQYDSDYFKGDGFDKSIDYETEYHNQLNQKDLNDWDASTIKEMLDGQGGNGNYKLLDAGCGMGLFLSKAKQNGFEVEGLEYSEYAAKFVTSKGISVQNTTIENAELRDNYYDAIVMKEVIEHLPDPMISLQKLYKSLKPGGLLFVTTGNYNCPERKLRGSNWFYFMPAGHLYVFSNKTISNYLSKVGFKKINATNQGDLVHNILHRYNILSVNSFKPKSFIKKIIFWKMRLINHFISSGLRVYAIK